MSPAGIAWANTVLLQARAVAVGIAGFRSFSSGFYSIFDTVFHITLHSHHAHHTHMFPNTF